MRAAISLMGGALVFTVLSALLDRWAQPGCQAIPADEYKGSAKLDTDAAATERPPAPVSTHGAAGMALLAAVTLDGVPENGALEAISLPLAFAAGAVIASFADTLMPEAYEHGGPAVALSTAAGFVLAFVLSLA